MDLREKKILVLGATGNVGHGVAAAVAEAGATPIVISRDKERAKQLGALFPTAQVLVGDVSDAADADRLGREVGAVDHVLVSSGGWWQKGPFVRQPAVEYDEARRMLLDAQVHAARVFLPRTAETGSFTLVTGVGATLTIPNASMLAIATAGVLALSRSLRLEQRAGPRVNELRIASRIERAPRPGVVPSIAFGRAVLKLFTSTTRGAIIGFDRPESFDPAAHVEER
ncbi:MAG: SDR family oxidoreductase [Myxococcaceae bacterium]|nr:SDR family oxidoreductase [Myxococcaceae bacterium]